MTKLERPPEFLSTIRHPLKELRIFVIKFPEAMKYYKQSTNKSFSFCLTCLTEKPFVIVLSEYEYRIPMHEN